jgi:hypothetical protein
MRVTVVLAGDHRIPHARHLVTIDPSFAAFGSGAYFLAGPGVAWNEMLPLGDFWWTFAMCFCSRSFRSKPALGWQCGQRTSSWLVAPTAGAAGVAGSGLASCCGPVAGPGAFAVAVSAPPAASLNSSWTSIKWRSENLMMTGFPISLTLIEG